MAVSCVYNRQYEKVCFFITFHSSAVTIGFNAIAYTVTEGGSVSVGIAVQSGTLARDVVVTLQTVDGSATGSK